MRFGLENIENDSRGSVDVPTRWPTTSVSHYCCPADVGFDTFLGEACDAGFTGVALTARSFDERSLAQIRQAIRARDLSITSVNSAGLFLDGRPPHETQREKNLRLLEQTAELEAHALNIIVGGIRQAECGLEEARSRVLEGLYRLADRAAELGVMLIVEPVHPSLIGDKGCLNTIRQVIEAIAPIPDTAKINIDLFHSWWDPDIIAAVRDPDLPLGLLQICDVALTPEPPFAQRVPPGLGMLDLQGTIRSAVKHLSGGEVPVEVEVIFEQLGNYDFKGMLKQTIRIVHAALAQGSVEALKSDRSDADEPAQVQHVRQRISHA